MKQATFADLGLRRQEETHQAREISDRDGAGGAVGALVGADRAALSEGGAAGGTIMRKIADKPP